MSVLVPHRLDEALQLLATERAAQVLAGGTDFMVEVNYGHRRPSTVVSLRAVDELRGWRQAGDFLVLGAGLTYDEMIRPEFGTVAPALSQAARTVGSPQIRSTGTLGGNIATASPAGDTLPVLEQMAHRNAVNGVALSVVALGSQSDLDHIDRLVAAGQGNRRILASAEAAEALAFQPLMAILVVYLALLWITQHLVGLGRLFEFIFGFFIVRVSVWMEF